VGVNWFNGVVYVAMYMELRIAIRDGMLDFTTHRIMKWLSSYVSATYGLMPSGMDLEGTAFEIDATLCRKIVKDIRKRFRRHLRYIEVECLEY
jgi:hypothetical protein